MLVVTTPATDPWLLTQAQAAAAAGIPLVGNEAAMETLRAKVSANIYDALAIAVGNGAEPTIRKERLTETIMVRGGGPIILSRRHNVAVVSISDWPGISSGSDYYVEAESGIIRPAVEQYCPSVGGYSAVTVVYDAGFQTVPPVLLAAATDMVRIHQSEALRDPLVKKSVVEVEGVDRVETEFWVTAAGATAQTMPVPPLILATLRRFRNSVYA